ncbi:hypothetical protein ACVMB0_000013 [Bradyrhizobium sp. USDA 4451]
MSFRSGQAKARWFAVWPGVAHGFLPEAFTLDHITVATFHVGCKIAVGGRFRIVLLSKSGREKRCGVSAWTLATVACLVRAFGE